MTPKVLVTGAGGFIGSHLVEALVTAGYPVKALIRARPDHSRGCLQYLPLEIIKSLEVIVGDIRNAEAIRAWLQDCEIVIHLAALNAEPTISQRTQTFIDTNVTGTLNLLHAALIDDLRFIHTSSSDVYGPSLYLPIDENHPLQGQTPYSASKIAADMLVESFFRSFGLQTAILRPFPVFGPRQNPHEKIPALIHQLVNGERNFSLAQAKPYWNLTYISDLIQAYLKLLQEGQLQGELIHIGQAQDMAYDVLLTLLAELLGINIHLPDPLAKGSRYPCQTTKARQLLAWTPQVSVQAGLEKTLAWYQS